MKTIRDATKFSDLAETFLESGMIGELCRKGKQVFYAFYENYTLYCEGQTKTQVAYKLASFYQNR